ncbi:MAG: TldD/PmbA family protein, partial [Chloroflexi bacterium]|nr:TldD/PmbA family protein [Chloroflexota bacterium]
MRDRIESALKGHNADYIEIRIEETEAARIQYRDRMIEDIGRTTGLGGNVRALVKGGWGFVSFNKLDDLREKVALAVKQARLVGREKSELAPVAPAVDTVGITLQKDPSRVPLARKKEILDEYNELIWGTPKVQTSTIGYSDSRKKKTVATSEGTYIQQDRADVTLRMAAIAREGGDVQQAHLSLGSLGEFGFIEKLHDQVREMAARASQLLSAPKPKGGEYTVVLDPILAGVFTHEAFGHLSESDHVYENEKLREIMVLGRRFGGKHLNIIDGAAVPGLRGSYKYDDEST